MPVTSGTLQQTLEDIARSDIELSACTYERRYVMCGNYFIKSELEEDKLTVRRDVIVSVDVSLLVVPPLRIFCRDDRSWPRITAATATTQDGGAFVLCHSDLSAHNIFVDPDTFAIRAIMDWEYAGFSPARFETPLWRMLTPQDRGRLAQETRARDLALFGLVPSGLRDCVPPGP